MKNKEAIFKGTRPKIPQGWEHWSRQQTLHWQALHNPPGPLLVVVRSILSPLSFQKLALWGEIAITRGVTSPLRADGILL